MIIHDNTDEVKDIRVPNQTIRAWYYLCMATPSPCAKLLPDAFAAYGLEYLHEIPQPPEQLWLAGAPPPPELPLLSVVGSRAYTSYGKQAVRDLIEGLRGRPVGIVSGLARGIDGLAHEAALQADLYTLAIPGSGLDPSVIYPRQHKGLAERIVASGGGLLSELAPTTRASKWTFPERNRLMAGLCRATLLIEASERSGTLITARLTVEYDRDLLVVPGSIYSPQSRGTHQFLKLGATPVTTSEDIAVALDLPDAVVADTTAPTAQENLRPEAQHVLATLTTPTDIDGIIAASGLPGHTVSAILMELEIDGYIHVINGLYQARI